MGSRDRKRGRGRNVPESRQRAEDEQHDLAVRDGDPDAECADPGDTEYEHELGRVDVADLAELRVMGSVSERDWRTGGGRMGTYG